MGLFPQNSILSMCTYVLKKNVGKLLQSQLLSSINLIVRKMSRAKFTEHTITMNDEAVSLGLESGLLLPLELEPRN